MNTDYQCRGCGKAALPGDGFCKACGAPLPPAIRKTWGQALRQISLLQWGLGLGAIAAVLILIIKFNLFLRVMAIAGTVLLVFSVVIMLLTFRKAKKISPVSLGISMLVSLLSLGIYSFFIKVHFTGAVMFWTMASGILIGVGWALITPVSVRDGLVKREGNLWTLAVWGLVLVINQLTVALTGRPPQIAMVLLLSGTGIVLGSSGSFIAMFYRAKSGRRSS